MHKPRNERLWTDRQTGYALTRLLAHSFTLIIMSSYSHSNVKVCTLLLHSCTRQSSAQNITDDETKQRYRPLIYAMTPRLPDASPLQCSSVLLLSVPRHHAGLQGAGTGRMGVVVVLGEVWSASPHSCSGISSPSS